MNVKTLMATLLASLLMAGSVSAGESATLEERMAKLSQRDQQTREITAQRVMALESEVKQLQQTIRLLQEK